VLATFGALVFGISLYAAGHLSGELPISWVLLPARLTGTLALTIPLALTGNLQLTRKAAPLVLAMGFTEVIGITAFSIGEHPVVKDGGASAVSGKLTLAFIPAFCQTEGQVLVFPEHQQARAALCERNVTQVNAILKNLAEWRLIHHPIVSKGGAIQDDNGGLMRSPPLRIVRFFSLFRCPLLLKRLFSLSTVKSPSCVVFTTTQNLLTITSIIDRDCCRKNHSKMENRVSPLEKRPWSERKN
jgi:hypothetical protein